MQRDGWKFRKMHDGRLMIHVSDTRPAPDGRRQIRFVEFGHGFTDAEVLAVCDSMNARLGLTVEQSTEPLPEIQIATLTDADLAWAAKRAQELIANGTIKSRESEEGEKDR